MTLNVGKEMNTLQKLTVAELRHRYREAFGESSRSRHKTFLIRRILWRLQANEEGDLSERARLRARELAQGADVRLTAPKPKAAGEEGPTHAVELQLSQDERLPVPGTLLVREYKGTRIEVRVLPHGFEYEGELYRTLSAVAQKVTGTHWNGYHFFRLVRKGNAHGRQDD